MDTNLTTIIQERFNILPEKIRILLTTTPWFSSINNIANKYGLDEEQAEALRRETFFVLLAVRPLSDYRKNLIEGSELTYDQSLKIAGDINLTIFGPVMDALRLMEVEVREAEKMGNEENLETESQDNGAEKILESQFGDGKTKNVQNTQKPIPEITKEEIRTAPETHPEHILMDHEQMEKMDGVHLHSQSIMPSKVASTITEMPKNDAPKAPSIFRHQDTVQKDTVQTKTSFRSIVDEKLSGLVRSTNATTVKTTSDISTDTPSQIPTPETKPKTYSGGDPYREPLL